MTIGTLQIQELLIQADLLVYQAASATPVGSASMEATATGGRLRSPGPARGLVLCTTTSTLSPETATFVTTASQLVVSGIKNFKIKSYGIRD